MRPALNHELEGLIQNALLSRSALLKKLFDPRRDIDEECGHPNSISIGDYKELFERGDVASRVVSLLPEETWSDDPQIFENEDPEETDFERAWDDLNREKHVLTILQRADILSGIGRFGIVLLGLSDGEELNQPAPGISEMGEPVGGGGELELIYLRPLDESLVKVATLESNIRNPRYGLPLTYNVQFEDTGLIQPTDSKTATSTHSHQVHWTRVLHVCDNRTNSDVYGIPRMKKVFNRLLDLRKIAGASGEMFWQGGFPGIAIQTHPNLDPSSTTLDKAATRTEMDDYMNKLQRYIALIGMEAKTLSPNISDPTEHAELQLKLMAMTLGIPWRVLAGSEAAKLASEQDIQTWNKRLNRRRTEYVTPYIIRPFIDRLMALGVLPEVGDDGYQVDWRDLNSPSDEDTATVAEKQTNALSKYIQSGADAIMPPFHYLTLVLGLEDDEAESIIEAAEERNEELAEEREEEEARIRAEAEAQAAQRGNGEPPGGPGSTGGARPTPNPAQTR